MFLTKRIPGAIHLYWKNLLFTDSDGIVRFKPKEEIRDLLKDVGLTPEKEIVVYCFKGARASNTFMALKLAGFENVKQYFASWNEWSRDNSCKIENHPR